MRRARCATVVFSVLLVGAMGLTLGGCGGAASNSSIPAVAQVTRAAYVSSQGPGFKMLMTMSGDIGGESFSLNMSGAFDEHGQRGSMSETVEGKTVAVLMDLPYAYIQVAGKPIKGKPWARFNVEGFTQSLGIGSSLDNSGNPSQWLDFLKATGQASAVGMQTLRGVPTTHYHALVNFARYPTVAPAPLRKEAQQEGALLERISGQSSLPIDVWIDGSNRIRRYQVQVPLCYQGEHASESVSSELYDYGTQSIPAPPAASEVSDLSKELDSKSSGALQQLHC